MNELFSFVKNTLFAGMRAKINLTRGRSFAADSLLVKENGEDCGISYEFKEFWAFVNKFNIDVKRKNDTLVFFVDAEIEEDINSVYGFTAEKSVVFDLNCDFAPDRMVTNSHDAAFWMLPAFPKCFDELPNQAQFLSVEKDGAHYALLPLCGDNVKGEFFGPSLALSVGMSGKFHISGSFLAVSKADDPYTAVRNVYRDAHDLGGIRVPLRDGRELPALFNGFGWCTWDAFRHDVTSEKIYSKLDELKEKKIPLKWIMIDDGWSSFENWRLTAFEEDRTKFPEGLKACITRIKEEYGVEYVGVWHAYTGYWFGIDKTTALYEEQKENLVTCPCGMAIPSPDEEKAFAFWDKWHSYLADCGVDFLKIDNQSGYGPRFEGMYPTVEAVRASHAAIERSVMKNFGGGLINCMGMDMESVLSRPFTALSRNSDDFFPGKKRGFVQHLMQNAYNAVWHGNMYFCDYDMWWSCHESAVQSGVLRAVSGSPIYVSDEIGASVPEFILPVMEEDGMIPRPDLAAAPTLDCFYRDPVTSGNLLNIWNRSGDTFAAALFNVLEDEITGKLYFDSIPDIDKCREYVAYEYFSKKYCLFKSGDAIEATVKGDEVAVFSLYPVYTENGVRYADIGDVTKYVPIASKNKVKTALSAMGL